jgi:hypothetical protein
MVPDIVARIPTGDAVIAIVCERSVIAVDIKILGWFGCAFFYLIGYYHLLLLSSLPSASGPGMRRQGY